MTRRHILFVLPICLLLALPAVSRAASTTVDTVGSAFQPDTATITVGGTVTWTNHDTVAHNAVARDGSWRTPTFLPNATAELTFDTAGSFPYLCSLHPQMTGTINVVAAPATDTIAEGPGTPASEPWPVLVLAGLAGLVAGGRRFGRGRQPGAGNDTW